MIFRRKLPIKPAPEREIVELTPTRSWEYKGEVKSFTYKPLTERERAMQTLEVGNFQSIYNSGNYLTDCRRPNEEVLKLIFESRQRRFKRLK